MLCKYEQSTNNNQKSIKKGVPKKPMKCLKWQDLFKFMNLYPELFKNHWNMTKAMVFLLQLLFRAYYFLGSLCLNYTQYVLPSLLKRFQTAENWSLLSFRLIAMQCKFQKAKASHIHVYLLLRLRYTKSQTHTFKKSHFVSSPFMYLTAFFTLLSQPSQSIFTLISTV